MAGSSHEQHHAAGGQALTGKALTMTAAQATLHCLLGCSVGEVIGMAIGVAAHMPNLASALLGTGLSFVTGYSLTTIPLWRAGLGLKQALFLAFAADTVSILIMELVDNGLMLFIPGAMNAGLADPVYWESTAVSVVLSGLAAFPANRWLISKGKGHVLAHSHH